MVVLDSRLSKTYINLKEFSNMNIRLTVNVIRVSALRIPHIPEYTLNLSPMTIINLGKECTFLPLHTVNKIVPPWVPQTLKYQVHD